MQTRTYLTPQRKLVYETILDGNHPTATEIIDRLRHDGHKLAYATVYNSLHYLTDAGLIHELKIGDSPTRYDARTEHHHHIVCRSCGRIDEVFTHVPEEYLEETANQTHFAIDAVAIVLTGLCPQCRIS